MFLHSVPAGGSDITLNLPCASVGVGPGAATVRAHGGLIPASTGSPQWPGTAPCQAWHAPPPSSRSVTRMTTTTARQTITADMDGCAA